MSNSRTPTTIPELYDALMREFRGLSGRMDGLERRLDEFQEETRQGFIQVNQKIQDLTRVVGKLEDAVLPEEERTYGGGASNPYPRAARD